MARADLPTVLERLGAVTRPGGVLHLALKEGDGEAWSTRGTIQAPRCFVYWREEPLRAALSDAGWRVEQVLRRRGHRGEGWLQTTASRADRAT